MVVLIRGVRLREIYCIEINKELSIGEVIQVIFPSGSGEKNGSYKVIKIYSLMKEIILFVGKVEFANSTITESAYCATAGLLPENFDGNRGFFQIVKKVKEYKEGV